MRSTVALRLFQACRRGARSAIPRRAWPILASAPFTVAVIAIAILLAGVASSIYPLEVGPSDDATSALWAVQGAVVAFSLSLTLFAYEILPSEWAARRDLALVAAFPSALRLGFALLAVTGIALVFAPGDFAGWMRWIAFVLSATWGLILLFAFTQIANIRNQEHRLALRRADLRRTTSKTLRIQLVDRAAMHILGRRLEDNHARFSAWISTHAGDTDEQLFRSGRDGIVVDVDMSSLDRACAVAHDPGSSLEISVRLGQRVSQDSLLARSDRDLTVAARTHLSRAFVVRQFV